MQQAASVSNYLIYVVGAAAAVACVVGAALMKQRMTVAAAGPASGKVPLNFVELEEVGPYRPGPVVGASEYTI
jgi:hypothetical protein